MAHWVFVELHLRPCDIIYSFAVSISVCSPMALVLVKNKPPARPKTLYVSTIGLVLYLQLSKIISGVELREKQLRHSMNIHECLILWINNIIC